MTEVTEHCLPEGTEITCNCEYMDQQHSFRIIDCSNFVHTRSFLDGPKNCYFVHNQDEMHICCKPEIHSCLEDKQQ